MARLTCPRCNKRLLEFNGNSDAGGNFAVFAIVEFLTYVALLGGMGAGAWGWLAGLIAFGVVLAFTHHVMRFSSKHKCEACNVVWKYSDVRAAGVVSAEQKREV